MEYSFRGLREVDCYNGVAMKIKKRVFLPKWQRFYLMPMMLLIWGFITYMEFFNPENMEKMGMVGYVFMSALFLGIAVMMWLMTGGKLPAYIIEEEKEEKN